MGVCDDVACSCELRRTSGIVEVLWCSGGCIRYQSQSAGEFVCVGLASPPGALDG
jgi:hypothetical protein